MRPGRRGLRKRVETMKTRIASLAAALLLGIVAPEPVHAAQVSDATYWPVGYQSTYCSWLAAPNAAGYAAYVNGVRVPLETSASVSFIDTGRVEGLIGKLLGPADVVEFAPLDNEGRPGTAVRAGYKSYRYVFIPAATLQFGGRQTGLDPSALEQVQAFAQLLRQHGFTRMIAVGHDPGPVSPYRLGRLRAEAATSALGSLVAVAMTTRSDGNKSPLVPNATAADLAAARRVELGLR